MLCRFCQKMLRDIDDGSDEGRHYERAEDLFTASRASCYICSAMAEEISCGRVRTAENIVLRWRYSHKKSHEKDAEHCILYFDLESFTTHPSASCCFRLELEKPTIKPLPTNEGSFTLPPTSTSDIRVHLLAQKWLSNCLQRHSECSRERDPNFRPPRLLNVKENPPKLVIASSLPSAVSYATLSHCWGPNPTFKTLNNDNYEEFQVELPMDELPATFHQSIIFCINIGIDYLWIDSLCILQTGENSRSDWLHHVSVMPDIYANGTINIAAEWAKSSTQGMFIDRNPANIAWPLHMFHQPRLQGTRRIVWYGEERRDLESSASLRSRGWVAQERLFSPRIVRFGSDQVRWECSHFDGESERFPNGTDDAHRNVRFPTKIEHKHRRINRILTAMGIVRPPKYNFHPWYNYLFMVMEFSERAFTRPDSDKLAAFGAIAKHYSGTLKGRYVAGFYDFYFPHALMWTAKRPQKHFPVSQMYRAPSWSWAKSDMPIWFVVCRAKERIRPSSIKHLDVKLSDINNPYGQILSAELSMSGHLIPCTWEYVSTVKGNEIVKVMRFSIADHDYTFEGRRMFFDNEHDISGGQCDVFLYPIKSDNFGDDEFQFLILRRVGLSGSGTYERIGASDFLIPGRFSTLSRELRTLEEKVITLI